MKILDERKPKYLMLNCLKSGECFFFEDSDTIFMKTNFENAENRIECVDISNGAVSFMSFDTYITPLEAKVVLI